MKNVQTGSKGVVVNVWSDEARAAAAVARRGGSSHGDDESNRVRAGASDFKSSHFAARHATTDAMAATDTANDNVAEDAKTLRDHEVAADLHQKAADAHRHALSLSKNATNESPNMTSSKIYHKSQIEMHDAMSKFHGGYKNSLA
jgi:hypothetical protein